MFTGIVKYLAKVRAIHASGSNLTFELSAPFKEDIQIDQSISHNGACLTVIEIVSSHLSEETVYKVTAVDETLKKTNLGKVKEGDTLNLELSMKSGDMVDGHYVQGHVDTIGEVLEVKDVAGSWLFEFSFPSKFAHLLVDKGSICINGVSLTVIEASKDTFSVTIIPYTFEHTNFKHLMKGDIVNLEFDMIGKYLARYIDLYKDRIIQHT